MIEGVREWIDRGQYDLETARALLGSKRYLHTLFFCQQAIEKTIKGVIFSKTGRMPPRIHNLARLAEIAGVQDPKFSEMLAQFSNFYIESRYPEEIGVLAASTTKADAQRAIEQTEEVVKWLLSTLN